MYCLTKNCKNSDFKYPNKIFISVPTKIDQRNTWIRAVGRDPECYSLTSLLYICEDHFDLKNDMENYMRYTLVGGRKLMKKSVVPHKRLNNVNVESIVDRVIEENEKILQGLNVNNGRQRLTTLGKPTLTDGGVATKPTTPESCSSAMAGEFKSILRDMLHEPLPDSPRNGTKRKLSASTSTEREFDVDNVCRTCLSTGELTFLYQERLNEMLMECTSIKFHATDGLPLNICTNCITELNRSYKFVVKCRQSDAKLRIATKKHETETNHSYNNTVVDYQNSLNYEQNHSKQCDKIMKSRDPELVLVKHLNHDPIEIVTIPQSDPLEIHDDNAHIDLNIVKNEIDIKIEAPETYLTVKKVSAINQHFPNYQPELNNMPPLIDMGQQEEFQCNLCHQRFTTFTRLEKHHKANHKTKVFDKDKLHACTVCYKTFKYHYILNDHMRAHTTRLNLCHICKTTFAQETELWNHKRVHHELYTCRICNIMFERAVALQKHMKANHDILECGCCQKQFDDLKHLMDHYHAYHMKLTSQCPICGKLFSTETSLSEHMVSHTIEKAFPCTVCDRSFMEQHYLRDHMKTHTSKEMFTCPACVYITDKEIHLAKHMFLHKGEQFLSCTVCDRSFRQLPKLTEHMRTHAGEIYSCTICDSSFAQKDYLHKHMHKHTDREHFSCPVCSKLFYSPSSIDAHILKHAQDSSFMCAICNEEFCCITDFMRHIHNYPVNMKYMCTICKMKNKKM